MKIKVVVGVDVLGLKFSKGAFPDERRCLSLCDLCRRIDENRWKLMLLGSVERVMKVVVCGGGGYV